MGNSIPRELVLYTIDQYRKKLIISTKVIRTRFETYTPFTHQLDYFDIEEEIACNEEIIDHEGVAAAKNLRLVCRDFADTFDPKYVCDKIGGDFGRGHYKTIIADEMSVWNDYLLPICAGIELQGILNKYTKSWGGKTHRYNFISTTELIIKALTSIVQTPTLIYNWEYMNELIGIDPHDGLYKSNLQYAQNIDGEGSYTYIISENTTELRIIATKIENGYDLSFNLYTFNEYKPSGTINFSRVKDINTYHRKYIKPLYTRGVRYLWFEEPQGEILNINRIKQLAGYLQN